MKKTEMILLALGALALGVMVYLLATQRTAREGVLSSRLFDAPQCLAVDAQGNLYVGNAIRLRQGATIVKVSPDGNTTAYASGLPHATGLAVDRHGSLYLAGISGEVVKVGPGGQIEKIVHDGPTGDCSLAFDPEGNLHVANTMANTLCRVSASGRAEPRDIGCFRPGGMAFDKTGNLFVVNRSPGFVLKFSPSGEVRVFAEVRDARCLALDNAGNLFVGSASSQSGMVHRIDPLGRVTRVLVHDLGGVRSLALSPAGILFIVTESMRGIRFHRIGTPGLFLP